MVDLLPEELRKKEMPKKSIPPKEDIKFYIPAKEAKIPETPKKASWLAKIFQSKPVEPKIKNNHKNNSAPVKTITAIKRPRNSFWLFGKNKNKSPSIPMPKNGSKPQNKNNIPVPPQQKGIEITLMPEEKGKAEAKAQHSFLILGVFILLSVLLPVLVYVLINFYIQRNNSLIASTESQIQAVGQEIGLYQEEVANVFESQRRLDSAQGLLEKRIYWTDFMTWLERNTLPEVYYKDLTAGENRTIILSAVGADLGSAAHQIVAFEEASQAVKGVDAKSFTTQTKANNVKRTNFNITLTLTESVFTR